MVRHLLDCPSWSDSDDTDDTPQEEYDGSNRDALLSSPSDAANESPPSGVLAEAWSLTASGRGAPLFQTQAL